MGDAIRQRTQTGRGSFASRMKRDMFLPHQERGGGGEKERERGGRRVTESVRETGGEHAAYACRLVKKERARRERGESGGGGGGADTTFLF